MESVRGFLTHDHQRQDETSVICVNLYCGREWLRPISTMRRSLKYPASCTSYQLLEWRKKNHHAEATFPDIINRHVHGAEVLLLKSHVCPLSTTANQAGVRRCAGHHLFPCTGKPVNPMVLVAHRHYTTTTNLLGPNSKQLRFDAHFLSANFW